jgi:hypothetical protein
MIERRNDERSCCDLARAVGPGYSVPVSLIVIDSTFLAAPVLAAVRPA